MKKIVILTGAGISAESGLNTFRDAGGLWEGYNVYDVATPGSLGAKPGHGSGVFTIFAGKQFLPPYPTMHI